MIFRIFMNNSEKFLVKYVLSGLFFTEGKVFNLRFLIFVPDFWSILGSFKQTGVRKKQIRNLSMIFKFKMLNQPSCFSAKLIFINKFPMGIFRTLPTLHGLLVIFQRNKKLIQFPSQLPQVDPIFNWNRNNCILFKTCYSNKKHNKILHVSMIFIIFYDVDIISYLWKLNTFNFLLCFGFFQ